MGLWGKSIKKSAWNLVLLWMPPGGGEINRRIKMSVVVQLFTPEKIVANAVRERCKSLGLNSVKTYISISEALATYGNGFSVAWSVSRGNRKAVQLHKGIFDEKR
jgi:hypothetical protein